MISIITELTRKSIRVTNSEEIFSQSWTFESVGNIWVFNFTCRINWLKSICSFLILIKIPPGFLMEIWIRKLLSNISFSPLYTILCCVMDVRIICERNRSFWNNFIAVLINYGLEFISKVFFYIFTRSNRAIDWIWTCFLLSLSKITWTLFSFWWRCLFWLCLRFWLFLTVWFLLI